VDQVAPVPALSHLGVLSLPVLLALAMGLQRGLRAAAAGRQACDRGPRCT
jgi:hypothetical protein